MLKTAAPFLFTTLSPKTLALEYCIRKSDDKITHEDFIPSTDPICRMLIGCPINPSLRHILLFGPQLSQRDVQPQVGNSSRGEREICVGASTNYTMREL